MVCIVRAPIPDRQCYLCTCCYEGLRSFFIVFATNIITVRIPGKGVFNASAYFYMCVTFTMLLYI